MARALIALNPFELLAGRMFYEASERHVNRVPDAVFIEMGRKLDREHIPLAENLDSKGRAILKHLGRKGKPTKNWEVAVADNANRISARDDSDPRRGHDPKTIWNTESQC